MTTRPEIEEATGAYLRHLSRIPEKEIGAAEAREFNRKELVAEFGAQPVVGAVSDHVAGTVPVRVFRPDGTPGPGPVVLYIHGGGWTVGDLDSHAGVSRALCALAGVTVVAVDYRLAPEHRYPAAVDDCQAALEWVVTRADLGVDPREIAVVGDSSGGNLAGVVAQRAPGMGIRVRCQALIYPPVDSRSRSMSFEAMATGYGLEADEMRWYWSNYLGANPDHDDPGRSDAGHDPPGQSRARGGRGVRPFSSARRRTAAAMGRADVRGRGMTLSLDQVVATTSTPWWVEDALRDEAQHATLPALSGQAEADVTVVGGGYTGMWTAWLLKTHDPSLNVALVESGECGWGPSGRNGGFVHGYWGQLGQLVDLFGPDGALRVARAADDAQRAIVEFCRASDRDLWLNTAGIAMMSATPEQDVIVRESIAVARRLGIEDEVRDLSGTRARELCDSPRFRIGVYYEHGATVQPARLARELRRRTLEAGVRMHERHRDRRYGRPR